MIGFIKILSSKVTISNVYFLFNLLAGTVYFFERVDVFFGNSSYAIAYARYFITVVREMLE